MAVIFCVSQPFRLLCSEVHTYFILTHDDCFMTRFITLNAFGIYLTKALLTEVFRTADWFHQFNAYLLLYPSFFLKYCRTPMEYRFTLSFKKLSFIVIFLIQWILDFALRMFLFSLRLGSSSYRCFSTLLFSILLFRFCVLSRSNWQNFN
jgi:hypothetical protein